MHDSYLHYRTCHAVNTLVTACILGIDYFVHGNFTGTITKAIIEKKILLVLDLVLLVHINWKI